MARNPLNALSDIPPRKWLLPIPKNEYDTRRSMPFEQGLALVEQLGFTQINHSHGIRSSSFKHIRFKDGQLDGREEEDFYLYAHPSGALLTLESYSAGGDKKVNAIQVYIVTDMGAGRGASLKSFMINGSGGLDLLDDGTYVRASHFDPINGGQGLVYGLVQAQKAGWLVPFEKWTDPFVYLPSEYYVSWPAREEDAGLEMDAFNKKHAAEVEAGQEKLREKIHALGMPALADVLERCAWEQDRRRNSKSISKKGTPAWVKSELGVRMAGRIFEAAGKRWPSEAERQVVAGWAEALQADEANYVQPGNALSVGPAGITFPVMALHCGMRNGNLERAISALEQASDEELRAIVTSVDELGLNLPLHCFAAMMETDSLGLDWKRGEDGFPLERIEHLFNVIVQRLGPDALQLQTPRYNAMGLILGAESNPYDLEKFAHCAQKSQRLMVRADALGALVQLDARWESLVEDENKHGASRLLGNVSHYIPQEAAIQTLTGDPSKFGDGFELVRILQLRELEKSVAPAPMRKGPRL